MRARIAASVATAGVVASILAGCNFVTPVATMNHYDPSDGISRTVGDVRVLNAVVLTEDGEVGNLLFTAVNNSDDAVELTVQYESSGAKTDLTFDVPARGTTDVGYGTAGQQLLEGIDAPAGSLMPIYFQYGTEEGQQLRVPVLDNSLHQYTDLLATPTPTPTPEPTETMPVPTSTPSGTATPAP